MTSPRDERPLLGGAEGEFVDRLAAAYGPPPMTAGGRAAFDAALRARLERPWRRSLLLPAIGAATAAALGWLLFSQVTAPVPRFEEEESAAVLARSWEDALFLSSDLVATEDRDETEILPDDYLAIASVFLDE